jgi:glutamate---cysteine ligase / carboxylate-amine ligase
VFGRFPTTGIPRPLGTVAEYDAVVDDLRAVGLIEDGSFLYWDLRPSTRFDTLEFRVADVCQRVDEAVLLAALCRSLVRTAAGAVERGPARDVRPEVMRAARWQASRYGLDGDLVDLTGDAPARRPAAAVVDALLDHLRADLVARGEWDEVGDLLARLLAGGNGARRQRDALRQRGSLAGVVAAVTDETVSGVAPSGAAP